MLFGPWMRSLLVSDRRIVLITISSDTVNTWRRSAWRTSRFQPVTVCPKTSSIVATIPWEYLLLTGLFFSSSDGEIIRWILHIWFLWDVLWTTRVLEHRYQNNAANRWSDFPGRVLVFDDWNHENYTIMNQKSVISTAKISFRGSLNAGTVCYL